MIPRRFAVGAMSVVAGAMMITVDGPITAYGQALSNPTYTAKCQMCHQRSGEGIPGQFPRLRGRVGKMAASADGRRYLVQAVVNGFGGPITVDGKRIVGFMPPHPTISHDQLAVMLNGLLTNSDKAARFTAREVEQIRSGARVSGAQVYALRKRLEAAGIMP